MRSRLAMALRGAYSVADLAASSARLASLRARYPGLVVRGRVHVGPNCDIQVVGDSRLVLDDCYVSRGVTLTTGPGAQMEIAADYIGPNCTVVARERVTIGSGSKLAENVVVRDGNHDHAVPLREMRFTSAPVVIGNDVWLGASSIVLSGRRVGNHATVAAGAVVTHDVAAHSVVGGVPARPVSTRPR